MQYNTTLTDSAEGEGNVTSPSTPVPPRPHPTKQLARFPTAGTVTRRFMLDLKNVRPAPSAISWPLFPQLSAVFRMVRELRSCVTLTGTGLAAQEFVPHLFVSHVSPEQRGKLPVESER